MTEITEYTYRGFTLRRVEGGWLVVFRDKEALCPTAVEAEAVIDKALEVMECSETY